MSNMAADQSDTSLMGRRLIVARSEWIVVVALTLGPYLFSVPLQLAYYQIVCSGAACPADQISPAGLEQLRQAGLPLGFYAGYLTALNAMLVLVLSIVAAVIFWRKSDDWMGIFASLTLVVIGSAGNSVPLTLIGNLYTVLLFLSSFVIFLGGTCLVLFFYLFPDGQFVPRWIRWLVPLVVVHNGLNAFQPGLFGWFFGVEFASVLFAQIYRYRRVSNTVQRQQTKWVVFGSVVWAGGIVGLSLYANIAWPGGNPPAGIIDLIVTTAFSLIALLIPLSIGMAILRSHLWDIDLLIRRTLVYRALTGLLTLAYFGSVLALKGLVRLLQRLLGERLDNMTTFAEFRFFLDLAMRRYNLASVTFPASPRIPAWSLAGCLPSERRSQ